jgi:hypothetical protein
MSEKYAVFIITGHAGYNTDEERNLIEYESKIPLSFYSFAAPTEMCSYPPQALLELKEYLIKDADSGILNEKDFQKKIKKAQKKVMNFRYSDPVWLEGITSFPDKTELCYTNQKKYFEKSFTFDCTEQGIECGVYALHNNIGMEFGEKMFGVEDDIITMSDIVSVITTDALNLNKAYIFDCTCSIIYDFNLDQIDLTPEEQTLFLEKISKCGKRIPGGQKFSKYNFSQKIRYINKLKNLKKTTKQKKNKTKKMNKTKNNKNNKNNKKSK